jgi:hypothetical protein
MINSGTNFDATMYKVITIKQWGSNSMSNPTTNTSLINVNYLAGDVVIFNGSIYAVSIDVTLNPGSVFDAIDYKLIGSTIHKPYLSSNTISNTYLSIPEWAVGMSYNKGDLIKSLAGSIYMVNKDLPIGENTFTENNYSYVTTTREVFDPIAYVPLVTPWETNKDYIRGQMVSVDGQIYIVTDNVKSVGLQFSVSNYTKVSKDITPSADVKVWAANTNFVSGVIVSYLGKNYLVNNSFRTGITFKLNSYTPLTDKNALERLSKSYNPTVGMLPNSPEQLMSGIKYPGNLIDGYKFETPDMAGLDDFTFDNIPYDTSILGIDSNIQSKFIDLELGNRPEDINITGGVFMDSFSSHAPEELIPGMIYDSLNIKVFTLNTNDILYQSYLSSNTSAHINMEPFLPVLGFRLTKSMNSKWEFKRLSEVNSTTLAKELKLTDSTIYVTDVSKLAIPEPILNQPGIIYIGGEKITYYTINSDDNSISQLRRGVSGTGTPLIHNIGKLVEDASITQLLPGSDPVNNSWYANDSTLFTNGVLTQVVDGKGALAQSISNAAFALQGVRSFNPVIN